ncbi:amidohydrolase family protein [Rhizobium sp. L1K21]|uniref:amidohydrolase family protein n=1 Tax=Rhizobium sp. L1K21 TaxID=2954933 RepID=UPI002093AF18|nr:amidohydrolase family protein [Rhizobium sp. L1K21]MCO6188433.1 amidohydrolase [Rhizobium sp. L1K21]
MFGRGCQCCGIDVHTHVVPHDFPAYAGGNAPPAWPSMIAASDCHRTVVVNGKNYRTVSDACWSVDRRVAAMDEMGIGVQALSPMPELFNYWMDAVPARDLLRYTNDVIAGMIDAGQGRFCGLGAVPLQDIDMAIAELRRLVALGFSGVEIGSNINGVPVGDPSLLPFFEAAQDLDAAVFVHAVRPTGMDRLVGPGQLQQVLAYPTDVGLAAASCITSNMLLKLPRLRIAFSHGGGTLASLLPRLREGWSVFPALKDEIDEDPYVQARRFYVDSLVYDTPTLRHLISIFGDDRILIGTDYPFNFHDRKPRARISEQQSDAAIADKLTFANAAGFLGIIEQQRGNDLNMQAR